MSNYGGIFGPNTVKFEVEITVGSNKCSTCNHDEWWHKSYKPRNYINPQKVEDQPKLRFLDGGEALISGDF